MVDNTAPTVDSPRDYKIAWLTAEVARKEAALANTRAVLITEKMVPDLDVAHAVMFSDYDGQQNIVLAASLAEKWNRLKYLLPDAATIIDAVFEEDDEDTRKVLANLKLYPLPVLRWLENGLANWSEYGGRSLDPQTVMREVLESLAELAQNHSSVRPEPALSLMQHYRRMWQRAGNHC